MDLVATPQLATLNPLIAQSVALSIYSNAFLRGKVEEPHELLGEHSAFRSTHELNFERLGPGERPVPLADGVAPWLRRLQKEEVSRLRLVLVPFPLVKVNRVAGLPDPRWGMVTEGDVGTELWAPNWSIRIGINAREVAAPWKVCWQAEKSSRSFMRGDEPIAEATSKLIESLRVMASFIRAAGEDTEKSTYEQLLRAANDSSLPISVESHPELFPEGILSTEANRLGALSALSIGLFTAAGWKDDRFPIEQIQKAFEKARDKVWERAIVGLQSAVNTGAE